MLLETQVKYFPFRRKEIHLMFSYTIIKQMAFILFFTFHLVKSQFYAPLGSETFLINPILR